MLLLLGPQVRVCAALFAALCHRTQCRTLDRLYRSIQCVVPRAVCDNNVYHSIQCVVPRAVCDNNVYHSIQCVAPRAVCHNNVYRSHQ